MGIPVRVWTPEAVARLRQLAGKTSAAWIAKDLGVTRDAVYMKMSALKLRGRPPGSPKVKKPANMPRPTRVGNKGRVAREERMMQLVANIARLKSWEERASEWR